MKIKDIILISITGLAFMYMLGFFYFIPYLDSNHLLKGGMIWCLCGIWLATFFYANLEERHEDIKQR